ncbi:unnamed protein product [Rotaria magnacalcarata]|uniref:Reverse transcriptase domain-containing protein n=1 Tax=Rotaria magnacalcarata TaxID=392030 RepID=A0A8S2PK15_9BILA|nr:unnamed protein product [Rotaria magnacalcarata]CAF4123950.1 unnamed protein product [Rotaria magnacalcarata]
MPTTGISKFLNKLIRPVLDKHARSTTIIDGVDLIHRLEAYTTNGYLKSKTYLCTFDITDLYTMLPQEESLDILIEFLLQHGHQENSKYSNQYYSKQIIGDMMGSAFTLTLANIFMWKWEKQLVRQLKLSHEIHGRCITWVIKEYTLTTT